MNIKLDAEFVLENYKKHYDEFVKDLRSSDSQSKKNPESKFVYSFSWAEKIQGSSFQDILSGRARQNQIEQEKRSTKQRIDDRVARSLVTLCISTGRFKRYYYPILPLPEQIKNAIIQQENAAEKKRADFAKLTHEERQLAAHKALMELSGSPGFVHVKGV